MCLHKNPPVTSELTFTNLFMWRHHYNFRWCLSADNLLIIGQIADDLPFGLPPVGKDDLSRAFKLLLEFLASHTQSPEIHRVPEQLAKIYAGSIPFEVIPDPANHDYVYRAESLIHLSGRKYHRKRNHLKQFRNRYSYRYQALGSDLIEACLDLEEQWCHLRSCMDTPGLLKEERAIREALLHFEKLDCLGGVILVDDKVVAFSLGEKLNPDTAVIHLEKANPEFTGSYAVINQEFCQDAWRNFTYVNREQDLGESGLRQAKLSYYPDHMSNKVILRASLDAS
ncbi:MAG: phosphatidylglycerol lysyltransferase domain-containing protein [Deltaproteobacteria bacterium]|nr:phosphatidylglycerol lysyltransferase domain-containing protein [Deltaproteobacteria bacterium]